MRFLLLWTVAAFRGQSVSSGNTRTQNVSECYFDSETSGRGPTESGDILTHIVTIFGGERGVDGMYKKTTSKTFAKDDESWSLEWNGCAWYLYRALLLADHGCDDDVAAANVLFGNTKFSGWTDTDDQPYDAAICAAGNAAGYCSKAVFAGVCAATCGGNNPPHASHEECSVDNDAALAAFLDLQGETAFTCAQGKVLHGDDFCTGSADLGEASATVHKALCKRTCLHENFGDADKKEMTVGEYKDYYGGRRLYRLDSGRGGAPAGRRLATELSRRKEAVYVLMDGLNLTVSEVGAHYTLENRNFRDEGVDPAACATPNAPPSTLGGSVNDKSGVQQLTSTDICDIQKVGKDAGYILEHECPKLTGYVTQSHSFCPWVNVDITHPLVAPHSCHACGAACSGYDAVQDATGASNAVCAAREQCEALCTELGDECLSIDLVKGKDRCFLNRKQQRTNDPADGDYCDTEEGEVHFQVDHIHNAGAVNGQTPPEHPHHPDAYGLTTGERYPDRHVPDRRLFGNKLWGSSSYVHARKDVDKVTIYETRSNKFCRYNNINSSDLGTDVQYLCSACSFHGNVSHSDAGVHLRNCEGWGGLDNGTLNGVDENGRPIREDYMDQHEALCLDREECEAVCSSRADCVGFDMHKTLPICYLNRARCADATFHGIVYGNDHDLVEKRDADACQLTITGTPAARFAYGITGVYQSTDDSQQNYTKGVDFVEWDGCGYVLYLDGAAHFRTYAQTNCSTPTEGVTGGREGLLDAPAGAFNWTTAKLYTHHCLKVLGMSSEYFCEEYPRCPTFGYCMLSSTRLDREIEAFRGALVDASAAYCTINTTSVHQKGLNRTRIETIERYQPKAVADKTRVEYVYNMDSFEGNAEGHYLHQELHRDGTDVPRLRLQSLGASSAGVVTLAKPADAVTELGVGFALPEGYAAWVSDLIRIDRFDADGEPDSSAASFELWLDPALMGEHAAHADNFTVFRRTATGDFVDVTTEGATVAKVEPSALHHEAGWYLVTFAKLGGPDWSGPSPKAGMASFSCGAVDLAAAVDLNECKTVQCDENARCVNHMGTYECVCNAGWVSNGDSLAPGGQCVATAWTSNPLTVRVENDDDLAFGWRLQEIDIFADGECQHPVLQGGAFFFRRFEDRYCRDTNYIPDEVKSQKCETKCKGGSKSGPTTAECAGYLKVDKNSLAVCMPVDDCVQVCAADASCSGVDVHDYLPRCFFNKKDVTAEVPDPCAVAIEKDALGDDAHYALVYKDMGVSASSTSQYHEHPPSLAVDGSDHSEWWSGPHKVDALQEHVSVRLGGGAVVGSVRVKQHPRHAASQYRVHVGPAAGSLDVATYRHLRQSAGMVEARTPGFTKTVVQKVEKEASPCIDLTCGDRGAMFWQPASLLGPGALGTYDAVPSACHCKQLCLDHIDEGCQSYAFYSESDTNFWQDPSYHTHTTCYLWSTPYVKSATKAHPDWTSGAPDVVLFSLGDQVATSGEAFTINIRGVGVTSADQRIRIVAADDDCSGALTGTVVGLSCAEHVCRPPPTLVEDDQATSPKSMASWDVTMHANGKFKVCYCAGPCFAADQYTAVPGTLTVKGAGTFHVAEGLTTATESFTATVTAEETLGDKNVTHAHAVFGATHGIKLVAVTDAVLAAADSNASCAGERAWNVSHAGAAGEEVFTVSLKTVTAFEYLVCARLGKEHAADWVPLPVVAGTGAPQKYLRLAAVEADWQTQNGIFGNTAVSAKLGSTATIAIAGRGLDANNGTIALTTAATCAEAAAGDSWSPTLWADGFLHIVPSSRTQEAITYTVEVADIEAGKYTICMCKPGDRVLSTKPWATAQAATTASIKEALWNHSYAAYHLSNTSDIETLLAGDVIGAIDKILHKFTDAVSDALDAYRENLLDFAAGYMDEDLLASHGLTRDEDMAALNRTMREALVDKAVELRTALFTAIDADLVTWNGQDGGNLDHCGSPNVFSEDAGKFYVTNRVDLGVDFVLDAGGAQASLEITGSGLDPSRDRIVLVNCQDTCGLAKPTSQASSPEGPLLGAFRFFEPVADELARSTDNPFLVHDDFHKIPSRYCAGHDLLSQVELSDQLGVDMLASKNLCHKKCVVDGCTGDHCYCDGYVAGDVAVPADNALCLPAHECEHLCQLFDDCYGVDVHQATNRCYLKSSGCMDQVADTRELGLDEDWALHVKTANDWPESGADAPTRQPRQILDIDWAESARGALVSQSGSSTASVLRFSPIEFAAPGTYKVCFCDSEVQGECDAVEDYGLEIGKVYVTGLATLLAEPKLRTTTCTSMFYGGLSCATA